MSGQLLPSLRSANPLPESRARRTDDERDEVIFRMMRRFEAIYETSGPLKNLAV